MEKTLVSCSSCRVTTTNRLWSRLLSTTESTGTHFVKQNQKSVKTYLKPSSAVFFSLLFQLLNHNSCKFAEMILYLYNQTYVEHYIHFQ